jgi:hypothetical protein
MSAQAAITFSNITIGGSLSTGAFAVPGATDIDFVFPFPAGTVGDPVNPVRAGNIVITFDVDSTIPQTADILSILGTTQGSGRIVFNEVVEDRTPGFEGIIASTSVVIDANNPPPVDFTLNFSRPSSSFKVKKTIFLFAPDTQAIDIAQVGLVEQRIVPTPGALGLMAAAGLLTARRRR